MYETKEHGKIVMQSIMHSNLTNNARTQCATPLIREMSESVLIGAGSSAGSSSSNQYDLTPVMASYLDVHMVIPLIDHLREVQQWHETMLKGIYKKNVF